jgi:hypothetical protein
VLADDFAQFFLESRFAQLSVEDQGITSLSIAQNLRTFAQNLHFSRSKLKIKNSKKVVGS